MPRCTSGRSRYLSSSGSSVCSVLCPAWMSTKSNPLRLCAQPYACSIVFALSRRRHPPSGPAAPCATTATRWIAGITGRRWVRGAPELDGLVELGQHVGLGVFAEHAHLLRVRVAVVRDDTLLRQDRSFERLGTLGPAGHRLSTGADGGLERVIVLLAAPIDQARRDGVGFREHHGAAGCGCRVERAAGLRRNLTVRRVRRSASASRCFGIGARTARADGGRCQENEYELGGTRGHFFSRGAKFEPEYVVRGTVRGSACAVGLERVAPRDFGDRRCGMTIVDAGREKGRHVDGLSRAPRVGLEPTTTRLTVERSTN